MMPFAPTQDQAMRICRAALSAARLLDQENEHRVRAPLVEGFVEAGRLVEKRKRPWLVSATTDGGSEAEGRDAP